MERKRGREELSRDEFKQAEQHPAPAGAGVSVPGADPAAAIAAAEGEFAPLPPEPEPTADGTVAPADQVAPAGESIAAAARRLQAAAQ